MAGIARRTRTLFLTLAIALSGCAAAPGLQAPVNTLAGELAAAGIPNGVKTVKAEWGSVTLGLLADSAADRKAKAEEFDAELPLYEEDGAFPGIGIMANKKGQAAKVDLRSFASPIRNQGNMGSCTAFAGTGLMEMVLNIKGAKAAGKKVKHLSPLFFYYAERQAMEESGDSPKATKNDTGASSGLAATTAIKVGAVREEDAPYKDGKPGIAWKPSPELFEAAGEYKFKSKKRINTIQGMKAALAAKKPFVFGLVLYKSHMTEAVAKTGDLPLPAKGEDIIGGHAVVCVGYDDAKQAFIVRNSWGTGWGDKGYFYMPYEFFKTQYVGFRYFNCWTLD
jgi:C1A family cysteine protease